MHEQAYLSFTKALSIPHVGQGPNNELLNELSLSYGKALLLNKLIQIHNCCGTIDSTSVPDKRTALSLPHLIHFTQQNSMQALKRSSEGYLQLNNVIENDTRKKLNISQVKNSQSQDGQFEEDAMFEEAEHKQGANGGGSKIDLVVSTHFEHVFNPNGDMELIQAIT